jgi:hypothetical protein
MITIGVLKMICANSSCWEESSFVDGGVTVALGPGWHCLMMDRHFSNSHGCVQRRCGGFCDGIAAHAQGSTSRIRILEAKQQLDLAAAAPQLRRCAERVLKLPGAVTQDVSAELHVGALPRLTVRPRRRWLQVGLVRLPISVYVTGEKRF